MDSNREGRTVAELDKDAFFSTVIHELRAPLNACLMSVNLLELKASQPDEVLRCAEVFRRNLDRQARLIQDLSDVLQIVSGGIELDTEAADLGELVGAAVERYRGGAESALPVRWSGAELPVEADTERLAHVLDTLLEHQAAAAAAGQDEALAFAVEQEGAGVRLTLRRVPPAGAGEAGDGAFRDQKGFAVRLAVAEQVIAAHGGRLERMPGGFALELPRRPGRA
ncbi:MAG: HAMP domain-containing histidine kinase [Gammaproteobacteria bacterium]|nr:HAMP domain-containing histidine kinase [Gammaproteobacteria bacterium]